MKSNLPDATAFVGAQVPDTDYRITRLLGSGCNGHVFVAHADTMAHDVCDFPASPGRPSRARPGRWVTRAA